MVSVALLLFWMASNPCKVAMAEVNADLRDKLVEMGIEDQSIRAKLQPLSTSGNFRSDEFKTAVQEMAVIDASNLAELERIIERFGWPGMDLVGADASNAAFLILQHSPLAAKKKLLPVFQEAVSAGKARSADLAMLEDRILVGDGKKQLYGTQITSGSDGAPRVAPIEDPGNLDARREAVGLPTIDEYLDRAEAEMGRTIDRTALYSVSSQ
jgi:hypothetical protein